MRKTPGYDDPAKIAELTDALDQDDGRFWKAQLAKGGAFMAGEQFTLADIAIALSVHRWFMTPFERKALPAVSDYYERMKLREAGAPWMGEKTP